MTPHCFAFHGDTPRPELELGRLQREVSWGLGSETFIDQRPHKTDHVDHPLDHRPIEVPERLGDPG